MDDLLVCPRCDNYYQPLTSIGRWQCRYHPRDYDVDKGFLCCGRKVREVSYNQTYVLLGATEKFLPDPKGCTPCDCGSDLSTIHIDKIAQHIDQIDISQWKGFAYPNLYRSKYQYDTRL